MSKSNKNNKRGKAAALKYDQQSDNAPVVIASGYGVVAEKIIDIAEQKGIPVYRDDSAASLLCMLNVGTSIPEELYKVVAAVYKEILITASGQKEWQAQTDNQNPDVKAQSGAENE